MTALCSGKICTIFPEKGALNFWKACTIALEYSVLLMISLAGCSKSMNYVIGNEPSFVGTVEVVTDEYVLVNVNDDDAIYSDHPNIQVSLDVELKDSYLDLSSGDEIVVYYDGSIIDEKAETVYAITLRTPANRETQ